MVAPLLRSLSLFIFSFEGTKISLNVSKFLAIVACSRVLGLALTSCICRLSRITSSSTIQLVGRTVYYISITSRFIYKRFPLSIFRPNGARNLGVLYAIVDALHTVVTKVSHEEGRLLISKRAFRSLSIIIP